MISDSELRARLMNYNVQVPPITDMTRKVLLHKLDVLDQEQKKKLSRRTNLLDYSSGEEECQAAGQPKQRKKVPGTYCAARTNGRTAATSYNQKRHPAYQQPKSLPSRMMRYSETEEEENGDNDVDVDEEDDDDEEDEEEEEAEYQGHSGAEENHTEVVRRRNFSCQTSPRLDESPPVIIRNGSRSPYSSTTSRPERFKSSPAVAYVPSTASYLSMQPALSASASRPTRSPSSSSPVPSCTFGYTPASSTSVLRRSIAQNEKEFGSLGEALDSLPRSADSKSEPMVVQVVKCSSSPSSCSTSNIKESKYEYLSKNSGLCNSHTISKIIILLVAFFFASLFYMYATLRPQIDILPKLKICSDGVADADNECVLTSQIEPLSFVFKEMYALLDEIKACESGDHALDKAQLMETLQVHEQSEKLSTFNKLISILKQNPDLGVQVNENSLALASPRINWVCWLSMRLQVLMGYAVLAANVAIFSVVILALLLALYKLYVWHQESVLREKQDVYEMVEKVLSLLMQQHQLALRGGSPVKSGLAITHIRDQLIPVAERKRKKKLWDKVVTYIRDSESRVRESVEAVYGEETRVWRWIQDYNWSPDGPNPYVVAPSNVMATPPHQSVSPTGSTLWQGSAFNSLNKNVAAPLVALTTCLKVRHMFERRHNSIPHGFGGQNWVWQIKEEIIRRCCSVHAAIVHVFVDKDSSEGCVYIKARSIDDAGKVFHALHGQWYKGNLVTVKYMREDRYSERFPDSKSCSLPLKSSS